MQLFKTFFKIYKPAIFIWLIFISLNTVILFDGLISHDSSIYSLVIWLFETLLPFILGPLMYILRFIPRGLPEIYTVFLVLTTYSILLLILHIFVYFVYHKFQKIKTRKNRILALAFVVFLLLLYFPKFNGSQRFDFNGTDKLRECGCIGYRLTLGGKGSDFFQTSSFCYGIPLSCKVSYKPHR